MPTNRKRPQQRHEQPSDEARERAEALVKRRQEFKADEPLAMQEYRAAEKAIRDRTARLREQRLVREAAKKR
jgi:hypothetical protein